MAAQQGLPRCEQMLQCHRTELHEDWYFVLAERRFPDAPGAEARGATVQLAAGNLVGKLS